MRSGEGVRVRVGMGVKGREGEPPAVWVSGVVGAGMEVLIAGREEVEGAAASDEEG